MGNKKDEQLMGRERFTLHLRAELFTTTTYLDNHGCAVATRMREMGYTVAKKGGWSVGGNYVTLRNDNGFELASFEMVGDGPDKVVRGYENPRNIRITLEKDKA